MARTETEQDRELTLDEAEGLVRDLPIPHSFSFALAKAAVWVGAVGLAIWWLGGFSPWWALLAFAPALHLELRRELRTESLPSSRDRPNA